MSATKIGQYNYEVKHLLGAPNYQEWKTAMEHVLSVDGVLKVVNGKELKPIGPPKEPGEDASIDDVKWFRKQSDTYDKKLEKWEDKNEKACGRLKIACSQEALVEIQTMDSAKDIWDKLKKFDHPASTTLRIKWREFIKVSQSNHKSVQEYGAHVKRIAQECKNAGQEIGDWQLRNSFTAGLDPDYEQYILPIEQQFDDTPTPLSVDSMIKKLVDWESRRKDQEPETKALNTRTPKKEDKDKKHKKPCKGCGIPGHTADKCKYLNPHLRSEGWKPGKGREHLVKKDESKDENKTSKEPKTTMVATLKLPTTKSLKTTSKDENWWMDSGSDVHITYNRDLFETFKPVQKSVMGVHNTPLDIRGTGTVTLQCNVEGTQRQLTMQNVHYCPDAEYNLFSIGVAEKKGFEFSIKDGRIKCLNSREEVTLTGTRHQEGATYTMDLVNPKSLRTNDSGVSWTNWHRRLAHLNMEDVKRLPGMADGIDVSTANKLESIEVSPAICESCAVGKHTRNLVKTSRKRATRIGEIIHSDIAGGGKLPLTLGGARYVLSLIDDYSNFMTIYLLKRKSEAYMALKQFISYMENRQTPVSIFRSDNGGEYSANHTQELLKNTGVEWDPTAPYNPNQNGVAERNFRTLFERVRAVLYHGKMTHGFWGEAINYVCYLKNRSPTKRLKDKTPYEIWTGDKPNVSNVRIFGCTAYHYNTDPAKKKLDDRSTKCRFLGIQGQNQFRLWDPSAKKVVISANVLWDESDAGWWKESREDEGNSEIGFLYLENTDDEATDTSTVVVSAPGEKSTLEPITATEVIGTEEAGNLTESEDSDDTDNESSQITTDLGASLPIAPTPEPTLRTSGRTKRQDYARINNPPRGFALRALKATATDHREPQSYQEALNSEFHAEYKAAMDDELESHKENNTWTLKKPPKNAHILPGRWVYKIKLGPEGEITRFKARWVVKGFRQLEGIEYDETFSSVIKAMIWKALLAIAAKYDLEADQIDVITAFLEATLFEEIWVEQPHGYVVPNLACRLNKALYGLKQSPREWYETLTIYLKQRGFKRVNEDYSLFVKGKMIVAIYVDDLLLIGPSKDEIANLKKELSDRFRIKDLGPVRWYLGMHITRDRANRTIYINQKAYVGRILDAMGMTDCHPCTTPMDADLRKEDYRASKKEVKAYQQLLGSLLWLAMMTRPDIAYSVNKCSRYATNPAPNHDNAAKRIVRYLAGTRDLGLTYAPNSDSGELVGYSDSSYGDCLDTRKSTSGYIFMLHNGPISWTTKRQSVVTTSSTEAEYIGQCNAGKEAVYLARTLKSIGYGIDGPIIIRADNQSAMKLAINPVFHPKSKHIDIQYHKIRELVENGEIKLNWIPTSDMVADGLTKPLKKALFQRFIEQLGLTKPSVEMDMAS